MSAEITMDARKQAVAAAAKAATEAPVGQRETSSITYKEKKLTRPVAKVALEHVLLNPRSHRIRSDIASLPAEETAVIQSDPFGPAAQDLIRRTLRSTDGFEQIKTSLEREGQRDAGVVTDSGVLINANTRAVALEELGEKYIDVIVLPSDATEREIDEIELTLQMTTDVRQPYSFTSELLFIEDMLESGRSVEEIGMLLRSDLPNDKRGRREAVDDVQKKLGQLALIRDVIEISGGQQTFKNFDDNRQALLEIDGAYQGMKNKRPEEALRLRDAQLTGMLADIDYRKLRHVDLSLIDQYVPAALGEDQILGEKAASLLNSTTATADGSEEDALEGLELFGPDEDGTAAGVDVSFRPLLTLVAQTDRKGTVVLPGDDESQAINGASVVNAVREVFLNALDSKEFDDSAGDILAAPSKFLRDASRAVDNARKAYEEVQGRADFDVDQFDDAQGQLLRALEAFEDVTSEKLSATPVAFADDDA